jgi:tRNA threonylcarbamoyladenosine biosynthesis protein TsaE
MVILISAARKTISIVSKPRVFISQSPEETASLGQAWAGELASGWVLGLSGDLGAGKTQLVKGLARGLGISGKISSPTFALVNEYREGRLPLFHLDLYRLETVAQIIGAGLEEYLSNPDGITVAEWIGRWLPEGTRDAKRPTRYRNVIIEQTGEDERRITYEDFGA